MLHTMNFLFTVAEEHVMRVLIALYVYVTDDRQMDSSCYKAKVT